MSWATKRSTKAENVTEGLHGIVEAPVRKDRWRVILEDVFRENVSAGWSVLVLSLTDAKRDRNAWVGQWQIFCISPDRTDRLQLVLRKNIEPRLILTTTGVTSFLRDLGFTVAAIPMVRGETVEITHDRRIRLDNEHI